MHGRARELCATITTKLAILMGQLAMINRGFFGMYTKPYGLFKLEALMGENLENHRVFQTHMRKSQLYMELSVGCWKVRPISPWENRTNHWQNPWTLLSFKLFQLPWYFFINIWHRLTNKWNIYIYEYIWIHSPKLWSAHRVWASSWEFFNIGTCGESIRLAISEYLESRNHSCTFFQGPTQGHRAHPLTTQDFHNWTSVNQQRGIALLLELNVRLTSKLGFSEHVGKRGQSPLVHHHHHHHHHHHYHHVYIYIWYIYIYIYIYIYHI